jgi:hypothetical protein
MGWRILVNVIHGTQTTKSLTWTPLRTNGLPINYNTIHNINVNKGVLTDSTIYINLIPHVLSGVHLDLLVVCVLILIKSLY